MYVCMYRGLPLWRFPWRKGVPTGPRRGTHRDHGSNVPTRGIINTMSRTLLRNNTLMCAFRSNFCSGQLRVTCILIFIETVSHRARKKLNVFYKFFECLESLGCIPAAGRQKKIPFVFLCSFSHLFFFPPGGGEMSVCLSVCLSVFPSFLAGR